MHEGYGRVVLLTEKVVPNEPFLSEDEEWWLNAVTEAIAEASRKMMIKVQEDINERILDSRRSEPK